MIFRAKNRRLDEMAGPIQARTAGKHLAARGTGTLERRQVTLHRGFVGQRAHQRGGLQRIADAHLLVGRDQFFDDFIGDVFVQEQPARAGAALAGGADRAEHDRRDGKLQVGRTVDDDGVVAAQFEQALAHALSHLCADLAADLAGAGERHQGDALVADEALGELMARFHEAGKYRRKISIFQRLVDNILNCGAAQHALRRRLPDGGIAADRGQQRIPGPDRDREIECGHDPDHAERVPLVVHPVARALGVHGLAVQHARLTDGEVADIDHFLDLAVALGLDFAHLHRDQAAERILVVSQRLGNPAHGLATARCRDLAPFACGLDGLLHDLFVIGSGCGMDTGDDFAGGRVDRVDATGVGGARPLAGAEAGAGVFGFQPEGIENALYVLGHGNFLANGGYRKARRHHCGRAEVKPPLSHSSPGLASARVGQGEHPGRDFVDYCCQQRFERGVDVARCRRHGDLTLLEQAAVA